MALYCDTSFFLSLVFKDNNYAAVKTAWLSHDARFSSTLLKFETLMAIRRVYTETENAEAFAEHRSRATELFSEIHLMQIDTSIYNMLESHPEVTHRTLDAIHLGTILHLKGSLVSEVSVGVYDNRLRKLCLQQNLKIV